MADIVRCALAPRLYRIYIQKETRIKSRAYEPNGLEQCGDGIIRALSYAWSICYYASPALAFYMYRKGFFSHGGIVYLSKFIGYLSVVLIGAYCIRGLGRFNNPDYRGFLDILAATKASNIEANKKKLRMFDFDYYDWPADYTWNETGRSEESKKYLETTTTTRVRHSSILSKIAAMPCTTIRYMFAHGLGRPLMFPGSVGLLQTGLAEPLLSGRTIYLEKGGKRAKLVAADGNEIDSMFFDKRSQYFEEVHKGNTLVIVCEGNAGFYELGLVSTPLKAGYSVLGWNHPGFAGSSGLPFPESERNAIDVVVQYATNELGFKLEDIVLYAWSIGGYTATWAGMTYPKLGGLVLDATFDDVVPLAQSKMPEAARGFVTAVVKEYFNLDNAKFVCKYPGPILLIRRMRDEIITIEEGNVGTNLGNNLLIKILRQRYPKLFNDESLDLLNEYLACPDQSVKLGLWNSMGVDVSECNDIVKNHIAEYGNNYPSQIGHNLSPEKKIHVLMFLVLQYLMDFDAAHCIPLPSTDFRLPWNG
ncbi:protein ABHD16A [Exaiptasia diaphana]|uniref:AB hydrolase-1 domain-containing protein n=1 Tax=Exaiptasia diaphana TaxID=2652724 RepID=A0A913Y7B2_EXADI|nr:protein ABHD16A [Exaiptasia diaphana]KXJ21817.1 Abhydrolase domain-containing protein 16A [Exaiptasia diaphana]